MEFAPAACDIITIVANFSCRLKTELFVRQLPPKLRLRHCNILDISRPSVCVKRLRADGFSVVDRPRPRVRDDTLATNHGGIVAMASPGIRLTSLNLGVKPETFEFVCIRVVADSASCVAAIVYRPGSQTITSPFFNELDDVMDRLATFVDPVYLVGDVNIRLERASDPSIRQFNNALTSYGFVNRVTSPTHARGGMQNARRRSRSRRPPAAVCSRR